MENLNVKVGDKVIVCTHHGGIGSRRICYVQDITPKGFIKVDKTLYYPNGRERTSDPWFYHTIIEATEDRLKEIEGEQKKDRAIRQCRNLTMENITAEQAEKILKILEVEK